MQQNIPVAGMCRDYMIPHFSFENQFAVDIPERVHWLDDDHHLIPPSSQTVYTDGSWGVLRTGAGICFNGLTSDLYFPLGHYTSVFQAETHAIMQCALALNWLDPSDEHICICSDSEAVLMALCNPRVVSKQIWECIGALNELASHRPVSLTWYQHTWVYQVMIRRTI